jgi:signal transduction histidine kinase
VIETLIVIGGGIVIAMICVYIVSRDIHLVFVRGLSYVCTLLVLTCIFLLSASLLLWGIGEINPYEAVTPLSVSAWISALLIAFIFPPIKRFFNRLTDALFYKENYSVGQFVTAINQALNSTNDLRNLLERVSAVIAKMVRTDQALFLVHLPEDHYMTAGTEGHAKVVPAEFEMFEGELKTRTRLTVISKLSRHAPLRRMMASHRIDLVMPLYKKELLVGYVCLGKPMNGVFTNRDLKALRAVADELAIAIQNAFSIDEVRKLNDTLEQRVTSATKELRMSNSQLQRLDEAKDEFISMASHQLRTPLTSIKGYISMILEGDVGRINKEQRHFLNEAFVSSERMVRLISDFLNVSRLQTGKFIIDKHPVDIALLVRRELDGLAQNAAARGMKFDFKKPKDLPLLNIDENKIQQVVMNFSDNAIYYSKDNSVIKVTLKKVGDSIEFRVIDSGIGVPKADQAHVFQKFFRATNARKARPDGTGVGLFLAKKVVQDHDGDIIFESKEGKGSTFGFRLPLPVEVSREA